ncbi:MAG: diacylglycerol kinase family protein [bacterium]
MFGHVSYLGYTLLFCIPPLLLFWMRREFFEILIKHIRPILLSTFVLTLYGSLIWPVAIRFGAWRYGSDKITNHMLFDYVYVEDVVWWLLISLIFSSFVTLSKCYEDKGLDIVLIEMKGLLKSFQDAFRGLKAVTLERNSTIHVAIATFVIIEGILFQISAQEWLFVFAAIGMVLGFELMNSSIECLATKLSVEMDAEIRLIKDAAAAAVLLASGAAVVIGVVIFASRFLAVL